MLTELTPRCIRFLRTPRGARGNPPSSSCLFAFALDSVMTAAMASANRRASASTNESEAVDREDHADAAQETEGEAHSEADASPHRARRSVGVHLRLTGD